MALAAAICAAAPSAAAQKGAPTWADKAAAQRLLREGNQAVGDGDYTAALAKFEAAKAKYPSPKLLVNIGTTLRLLGRYAEAAAAFEAYLADPAAEKGRVAEIHRALAEIDALVGRLKIVVREPDAKVRLDGKELASWKSGDVVRVNPGEHSVVAERPGRPPAVRSLRVAGNEVREVLLEFTAPQRVLIAPPSPQRPIGIAVGSVGAAGLVAFAITGSLALVDSKAVSAHCFPDSTACDQQGVDLAHRARTFGNASTGLLIGGASLLGAGLAVFLTAPQDAPREAPKAGFTWRVTAGPGGGGVEGTW
jgi:hypothetical protein